MSVVLNTDPHSKVYAPFLVWLAGPMFSGRLTWQTCFFAPTVYYLILEKRAKGSLQALETSVCQAVGY